MSDRIKNKIGEELYNQLLTHLKPNEFDLLDGFIPKSRFNEVNSEVKTLREQVELSKKSVEETKKMLEASEEFKTKYSELENKYNIDMALKDKDISNIQKITKIKDVLKDSGVKHTDLLMHKIDIDSLKLDGDNLVGITDVVAKLKTDYSDLFVTETNKSTTETTKSTNNNDDNEWDSKFSKL